MPLDCQQKPTNDCWTLVKCPTFFSGRFYAPDICPANLKGTSMLRVACGVERG